jgi:hypothetical protein
MASTLVTSRNKLRVTFTMNLYLCHLSHLTTSFLLSSKDIRHFILSKSRQPMATATYGHFLPIIRRQKNLIMGRTWYVIPAFDTSDPMTHVALFVFHCFAFCFVKALRWWGVTRSAQPHVHTHVLCPYVISTLFQLLEESQIWTSKRFFSCALFSSQLYT